MYFGELWSVLIIKDLQLWKKEQKQTSKRFEQLEQQEWQQQERTRNFSFGVGWGGDPEIV